jgi:allophanate hydrolase subunit 2
VRLADGEAIEIGVPRSGSRVYLAVLGGFAGPTLLGSLSADTFSGLGSPLVKPGDLLPVLTGPAPRKPHFDHPAVPAQVIEVVPGPRDDWFTAAAVESFYTQTWEVTAQANRVGIRLRGEPLERLVSGELESEGMLPGAVQVPTGGQPVIFGRDHPVTGGYPVIAVLTPPAQDAAGQLAPGARIKFTQADRSPG